MLAVKYPEILNMKQTTYKLIYFSNSLLCMMIFILNTILDTKVPELKYECSFKII